MNDSRDTDVLIVGAGPTGLRRRYGSPGWACACASSTRPPSRARPLARWPSRRAHSSYTASSASPNEVVEPGAKRSPSTSGSPAKRGRHVVGDMGAGLSPFPYTLIFPQDEHERLLIEHLRDAGVQVERRTELDRASKRSAAWHPGPRCERPDGCRGNLRGGLHRRLRRRPFDRPRSAADRLSRRHIRPPLLRRRRRGERARR